MFLTFLAVMKERRVSPEIFRNYMRYMYAVCFQELKLADAGQGGVLIDNFLHASALVEKLMNYLIYKSSDNSEDIHVSPMIRQICQYLKKNYAAQVSVETAAESVHKTANYISMRFKKEMGISFSEYLTDIRINRAVELLTSTNQSVQQVAERCGFGNYVYFSKILKQKTGKNATEIRKNKN